MAKKTAGGRGTPARPAPMPRRTGSGGTGGGKKGVPRLGK